MKGYEVRTDIQVIDDYYRGLNPQDEVEGLIAKNEFSRVYA
jgi:hypothetical protein